MVSEQLIPLQKECPPLVEVDTVYNPMCWHCNPEREHTVQHIPPPPSLNPKLASALGYYDLRPRGTHVPNSNSRLCSELKSFKLTNENKIKSQTPGTLVRQRSFMKMFGVDVLNKDQLVHFTRIMKAFMLELDYVPTDKADVLLFYSQESCEEIYDVYLARGNKTIYDFMQVFGVNSLNFEQVVDFMQLVRHYILSTTTNTPTTSELVAFFKNNDPNDVYLAVMSAHNKEIMSLVNTFSNITL